MKYTFITLYLAILWLWFSPRAAWGTEKPFFVLNEEQGFKGGEILQIRQLEDGRMLIVTQGYINLYDGLTVKNIRRSRAHCMSIKDYNGHTHLYIDCEQRLWIKNKFHAECLDLKTLRFASSPDSLTHHRPMDDLYVDSERKEVWAVHGQNICNIHNGRTLVLPQTAGLLQDLERCNGYYYLFTHLGNVVIYDADTGHIEAICPAYDTDEAAMTDRTSLVVYDAAGMFYQIRTGPKRSLLLSFNPATRTWRHLLERSHVLHSMIADAEGHLYITTPYGYLVYHTRDGKEEELDAFKLTDGNEISASINAIYIDREGGRWLGSHHDGVFHTTPPQQVSDAHEARLRLNPQLLAVQLHGKQLSVERGELPVDPPYLRQLSVAYNDNNLTFLLSAMKYVHPRHVQWRYRITGHHDDWQEASADTHPEWVDERGRLRIALVGLPPGAYALEAMATHNDKWDGQTYRLDFEVRQAWWQTTAAHSATAVAAVVLILMTAVLLRHWRQHAIRREQKEKALLCRIQELIEQVAAHEQDNDTAPLEQAAMEQIHESTAKEAQLVEKATALVQQHLADKNYSVAQLSRDLCMERTGLYRKLTAALDKTPVEFIRYIRLQRGAELLRQGDMTITEIAESISFSSVSYFSKCFQKVYGCTPSEYAASVHKDCKDRP